MKAILHSGKSLVAGIFEKAILLSGFKNAGFYKTYLLFIGLFLTAGVFKAQDLQKSRHESYYTYIYKITNQQAKSIYDIDAWGSVNEKILTQMADSFLTDSGYKKQLPVGHYVYVNAFNNSLHFEMKSINSIDAYLYVDKRRILFFPYTKNNLQPVNNAVVSLKKHKASHDKKTNAYKLKKTTEGFITVTLDKEEAYYSIEKKDNYRDDDEQWWQHIFKKRSSRRYYRNSGEHLNNGYVAFNKPKYLPGDTVKFKALVLTAKNKYFTGDVEVRFGPRSYNNKKLTVLKPVSPGAYTHQFVLGDSLTLDETYVIEICDSKTGKQLIESNNFKLEDYQLNETRYYIKADKKDYAKGEAVTFYTSGKDANGFNLLDTRVELKARVSYTSHFVGDSVFVPNVLWHTTQNLDPLGETKITMPGSVFPEADMSILIFATFNNSNNETHDTSFSIGYSAAKKKIITAFDSAYVKADYFFNSISAVKKGKLVKRIHNQDVEEIVSYPYKEKIDPNVSQYEFSADGITETVYNDEHTAYMYMSGYRTIDSVFIRTVNPHGLPFTYSIAKGSKEIEKGSSSDVKRSLKDDSKDPYYISYHYTWLGEPVDRMFAIQLYDKAIQVKIEQPTDIYPGQKAEVKIKVTDLHKTPVANVNLTAYAINAQFDRSNNPYPSYLGKVHRRSIQNDQYDLDVENQETGDLPLSDTWRAKMHLDTMTYYKMLYPKNGMYSNYDSVKTVNAQFSPFLFDKGRQVPVYIVYVDDYPVYYYDTDNADEYAFITSEGYHTLRIRTIDKDYRIDTVFMYEGLKLDLAIDVNNLPKNVTVFDKTNKLTAEEKTSVKNSVIFIYDQTGGDNYLWQDNKVVCMSKYRRYFSSSTLYRYGGFFPRTINFAVQNTFVRTFLFEPGYDHDIKKEVVKVTSNSFCEGDVMLAQNSKSFPKMGLRASTLSAIKLKGQTNWYKDFFTYNPNHTTDNHATYEYNYTGDSSICLVRVQKCGNDSFTRFYGRDSYSQTFYDLQPGFYNLTFITANKYFIQKDSVKMLPDGTFFQRFGDKAYKKYVVQSKNDTSKPMTTTNWQSPKEMALFNTYTYANDYEKGSGAIKVTVTDKKTKEPIPFANVVIYHTNTQVAVATSDMDGNAMIRPLPTGKYDIKIVYVGYRPQQVNDVIVQENKNSYVNMALSNEGAVSLDEISIIEYKIPLIDMDTKSGSVIDRESFQHMAAKDVNSVVSTQAGVVFAGDNSQIQVRGARPGSTNIFIDGERAIGTDEPAEKAKEMRTLFSDYAYWQPNLITDKNGEASFRVTFPDNVTNWKTYAIAMDDKRHSGRGWAETKAYKKLMVNLAMPRFMLSGDSARVIGKILNYTNKASSVSSLFTWNNQVLRQHDTLVENTVIENTLITPVGTDSVKVAYSITPEDGAKDGEELSIPVLPVGVEETNGSFFVLNRDTSFSLSLDQGVNEIYIQNNPLDFMLKEIEQLKNYPYWCMEQTASKLNALLMEEKIKAQLKQSFKDVKEIKKLLVKLEKGQKPNGSWGWWDNAPENIWMTAYITRIIYQAEKAGYEFKNSDKAKQYLLWNLSKLQGYDLLSVLHTFSEAEVSVPYAEYLKRFEKDSLNLYQKFLITRIRQKTKMPYDLKLIMKTKKETVLKSTYWGNDAFTWYDNSTNISLLAYKILENSDSNHRCLPSIRNYFLEIRNQNRWRNTIETAGILETILPALLRETGHAIKPTQVTIQGAINETVSVFPYRASLNKANQRLTVTKIGSAPAFFTLYQKHWNSQPQKKEDCYTIHTYYEVKGKKTDTLTAGVSTDLVVEVYANKKADYVMIEVPIPAGCSYDDNTFNVNYYEVHREYFKNKTSVFCQELPAGRHIFKIKLQPRFTGSYHLNPAKAELMYFPVFYGRNEIRRTQIK